MTRFAARSLTAAFAASAVGAVALASSASAATVAPGVPCARYIPGVAGQAWVPMTGSAFTPNTDPTLPSVGFTWSDGSGGGSTPLAADGSFATRILMPNDFIRTASGWTKTYGLTATDLTTPGIAAATQVAFVRVGASIRPRRVRRVSRRVSWSVYGVPTGRVIYAHWTFKGRRLATRKLGRAAGPCGI